MKIVNKLIPIIFLAITCTLTTEKIVPSYFDNGDRIYFRLPTTSGDTLNVYTDTGGGWTILYPHAIEKMGMTSKIRQDTSGTSYIMAEDVISDSDFHPHLYDDHLDISSQSFFTIPKQAMLDEFGISLDSDGFFGQFFFIHHCWTFDYINQKVLIHENCNLDISDPNTQKVGFKKDENGDKAFGHPSMDMMVNGDTLPMLFDTGATFSLSDSAQHILQLKSQIGGSFIAKSIFDKWKSEHPTWRIIPGGDEIKEQGKVFSTDMIEVPSITLGQVEVGPVWFSVRPDRAWSEYMIRSMDRVVKGALGGSALKYTSVTIDYPNETLRFSNQRPAAK